MLPFEAWAKSLSDSNHNLAPHHCGFFSYWKQRGKVRAVVKGDKNLRFFHTLASVRFRKKITIIEQNGTIFTDHSQKIQILADYFRHLLGHSHNPAWAFSLSDLYSQQIPQLASLDARSNDHEIAYAILSMNKAASPCLDGFGPGFYRKLQILTSH